MQHCQKSKAVSLVDEEATKNTVCKSQAFECHQSSEHYFICPCKCTVTTVFGAFTIFESKLTCSIKCIYLFRYNSSSMNNVIYWYGASKVQMYNFFQKICKHDVIN